MTALGLMIIFLLCYDTAVSGTVIYIRPINTSVSCISNLCLTLSDVASNFSYYQDNADISLVFLPGYHQLDSKFLIANVDKFSMIPDAILPDSIMITCGQQGNFFYLSVDSVFISDLNFINCSHTIELVSSCIAQNCTFQNSSTTAIKIVNSVILIKKSMFISNSVGACRSSKGDPYYYSVFLSGGSAIAAKRSSVTVEDSEFERNCAEIGEAI